MNRFQFVADHQPRHGVKRLCQILGVSRSSYYHWRSTAAARAARQATDVALADRIRAVHAAHDGTYGAPRITAELRDAGLAVNRKRVARVMRRFGVQGLRLGRRTRTTHGAGPGRGEGLGPDRPGLHRPAPNRRYVGDITCLPVGDGGFLYLATVIDLHSRRLAGWAIADHMRTGLVIDALHAARRTRGSLAGVIMHTDHGAQYTSKAFADACTTTGVRQSMSAVGSSADNAAAESFNATFKRETLQGRRAFTDERQARLTAFRWLPPLQHRPTPLPTRTAIPDHLREDHPTGTDYAGPGRINSVSKIRG
ncbi:IS3 family transposase [Plantactinospora solaniradicis]|uniref:IS3 family transposase n=1 Tax=Plantactinospora solaniradicis TaxID=1723736 RepID=A0ABW1KDN1_9ACTN